VIDAAHVALADAERRVLARLAQLTERLDSGDESAWSDFLPTVRTLRALVPEERRPLATTKEMAARFNVTPKTIRKLGARGKLEAVRLGKAGTGAIRWRA
jgi:excisionase family DNA binding protein